MTLGVVLHVVAKSVIVRTSGSLSSDKKDLTHNAALSIHQNYSVYHAHAIPILTKNNVIAVSFTC